MRVVDNDQDLEALAEKIGVLKPREVMRLDKVGETRFWQLVKAAEYETYHEGSELRITVRSVIARRQRLLDAAAAATPPRKTPLPRNPAAGSRKNPTAAASEVA